VKFIFVLTSAPHLDDVIARVEVFIHLAFLSKVTGPQDGRRSFTFVGCGQQVKRTLLEI
jgi:hypothetical protein